MRERLHLALTQLLESCITMSTLLFGGRSASSYPIHHRADSQKPRPMAAMGASGTPILKAQCAVAAPPSTRAFSDTAPVQNKETGNIQDIKRQCLPECRTAGEIKVGPKTCHSIISLTSVQKFQVSADIFEKLREFLSDHRIRFVNFPFKTYEATS